MVDVKKTTATEEVVPSSQELFVLLAVVLKKLGGELSVPKKDLDQTFENIDRVQIEGRQKGEFVELSCKDTIPESVVVDKNVLN